MIRGRFWPVGRWPVRRYFPRFPSRLPAGDIAGWPERMMIWCAISTTPSILHMVHTSPWYIAHTSPWVWGMPVEMLVCGACNQR